MSREFVKADVDIPDSELRSKRTNLFATVRVICCTIRALCCGTMQSDLTDISIWHTIKSVLHYSNCLTKVLNILARVTRGWKHAKELQLASDNPAAVGIVSEPPKPSELETAERLVLLSAMPDTYTAYKEGKLDSLIPKKEGPSLSPLVVWERKV